MVHPAARSILTVVQVKGASRGMSEWIEHGTDHGADRWHHIEEHNRDHASVSVCTIGVRSGEAYRDGCCNSVSAS